MSRITKRKYVQQEVMEMVVPTGDQQIVKITASRGHNLHGAVDAAGEMFLVSMPKKFRQNIYVKRGDFIIMDPIPEGGKVRGEITHILFPDHIRHIQEEGLWPRSFGCQVAKATTSSYLDDDLLPPSSDEEDSEGEADEEDEEDDDEEEEEDGDEEEEEDDDEEEEDDGEEEVEDDVVEEDDEEEEEEDDVVEEDDEEEKYDEEEDDKRTEQ